MQSFSGVRPGPPDGTRTFVCELSCAAFSDGSGTCAAIDAGLEKLDALFRRPPAFHDHIVQFFTQKLINHAFVLAADLKKVG